MDEVNETEQRTRAVFHSLAEPPRGSPASPYGPGAVWVPSDAAICTHRRRNHWDFERFRVFEPTLDLRVVGSIPTQLTSIQSRFFSSFATLNVRPQTRIESQLRDRPWLTGSV